MALYVSIFFGLFVFAMVTIAFGALGRKSDSLKRRMESVAAGAHKTVLPDENLEKPFSERFFKPLFKNLAQKFLKYVPEKDTARSEKKKSQDEKFKKTLQQAGFSLGVREYALIRFLVIAGTAIVFGTAAAIMNLGVRSVLGVLLGAYSGYAVMRFNLSSRISRRRRAIEQQLPDVLDLMSVSVEAGLGFEQALLHVTEHFEGCLIDELTVTYREMSMGRSRREALTLFAERCGLNEVKSFAGAVIQAGQMGIPMKNVLRTQAAAMRASRKSKVEEKAMKISVKILLPMVLFIFPVLFIVLMGPAAVKIITQFKG